jgi:hypothetical protein
VRHVALRFWVSSNLASMMGSGHEAISFTICARPQVEEGWLILKFLRRKHLRLKSRVVERSIVRIVLNKMVSGRVGAL